MKKSIQSLIAVAAFGALTLAASAQPAVKLLVIDMAKAYDNHYKTLEQNAKLQADDAKAREEVDKIKKEGNALVEEYKSLKDSAGSPMLSPDAKTKAASDADKKLEAIRAKQAEMNDFIQNTQNSIGQRLQTFRALMLEEISKVATDMAKKKGASLLLDKAGPTQIGVPPVVFSDPAYDITEEVLKELNKDKPLTAGTTPVDGKPAPAPGAPAAGGITMPSLNPTKK